MSNWQIIWRSLLHHWRINSAVALGVMAATAVLTGALFVGDSVRGSLRHLTLDRLGAIDEVLVTDRYFREELAQELSTAEVFEQQPSVTVPVVLMPRATVVTLGDSNPRRNTGVTVIGADETFWKLDTNGSRSGKPLQSGEVIVNEALARDLEVQVGDAVTLRFPTADQVPADSPLGRKTDRSRSLAQLRVVAILPNEGLGRFSLSPHQGLTYNAFVARAALQEALDERGRVNAILVSSGAAERGTTVEQSERLNEHLRPSLADYGLTLERIRRTWQPDASAAEEVIYDYYQLTSDRLLIHPAAKDAALRAWNDHQAQPVLTYLANLIELVAPERRSAARSAIPYSTVSAIDSIASLGPLLDENGEPLQLADDEIVLNRWSAEELQAEVGDEIRLTYFEPESTHGKNEEQSHTFRLRAIAPLTPAATPYTRRREATYQQRPALTNDPDLTPVVEGITDQETISDWDAPFPVDYDRIQPQDDDYWQSYRTTPKAFVSLAAGQELWGSRFGTVTAIRVPISASIEDVEAFREELEQSVLEQLWRHDAALGFQFQPIKREQLEASRGTTPFDLLFLGLSFFIIAAALMLVALLFRLGVEQRAAQVGTLLAVGLRRRRVTRLLALEGSLVALLGAAAGLPIGIGYAWLMLEGLTTWWVGAVGTTVLQLHTSPLSFLMGYVSSVLISVLAILWSLGRMRKVSVRRLLSGQAWPEAGSARQGRLPQAFAGALFLVALALAVLATTSLSGMAQAGAFVGAGAAFLTSLLLFVWQRLRTAGRAGNAMARAPLMRLATRSAGRNPMRSTITIGLVATASFLIVAMSAFRMRPTEEGTAGFDYVAESVQPIYADLNDAAAREELLVDRADELGESLVLSFRVKPGDDASCRNLYKPPQPRILGVTPATIAHFDQADVQHFAWASSAAEGPEQQQNPWRLLAGPAVAETEPVPVVIDLNTATYSLQVGGVGAVFPVRFPDGQTVEFRVVGLLANSILQGGLLIGEADFLRRFPEVSGYRFFLIKTQSAQAADALEDRLGDQGFDVTSADELLAAYLNVQNTYLSTFQSLGALGLLLGTFGLGTVQLRSVLERRGELALLRAAGFRRRRLAEMVLLEHAVLLLGGLLTGVVAALLAVLPHVWLGGASIPWRDLAVMLGAILVVGLLSGVAAVRTTLRAPLIAALRGE